MKIKDCIYKKLSTVSMLRSLPSMVTIVLLLLSSNVKIKYARVWKVLDRVPGPGNNYTIVVTSTTTWRRQWHPTPVLLPGKSHGRRCLVGCSPWVCKELDTTERLHFHFSLSCIGEGNGNPLQYSCLENPRDGGAWWAAVSGITQSWT